MLCDQRQGLLTATGLQTLGIGLQLAQQTQQSLPGERLVIDNQYLHKAAPGG